MKYPLTQALRATALAACLVAPAAWAATPADTLVIARDLNTFLTLDPQEAFEIASGDTLNNLYLRLVQHDPLDFAKIVPGAAKSWDADADGKRIVFHIRDDIKFQSGNPLTAEDAAFSLQRGVLLDKQSAILLRQFGWTSENVKERVRSEGNDLIVTFDKPFATELVLSTLSAAIASVVDKKVVMSHEKSGDLGNGWLRTNTAGAGAYKLIDWKPKGAVVLEAFDGYKGGKKATIKRVIVRHVAEAAAQRLLLEKGDVDAAVDLNADQIGGLQGVAGVKVERIPRATIFYMALNTSNPTLSKPEVWKAMHWLVDYEGMSKNLFKGQYRVTQTPVAEGTPGALTEKPYKFDPAKAKEILEKAGMPNGFTMDMDVIPATPYREIAQSIQHTAAAGGVKINLRVGEPSQVLTRYRERRFDSIVFVWAPDYADPSSTIEFFGRNIDDSDKSSNKNAPWRAHWLIPQLTAETSAAAHEVNNAKRMEDYAKIQRQLRDDSPFTYMLQFIQPIGVRSNIYNYTGGTTFDSTAFNVIEKK